MQTLFSLRIMISMNEDFVSGKYADHVEQGCQTGSPLDALRTGHANLTATKAKKHCDTS